MMDYQKFLQQKSQWNEASGFEPIEIPEWLYPFQRYLVEWAIRQGRGAIFADCGLGKTPMQLVWADNVVRHTNKPVLILTPLAVSQQAIREAEKFSIATRRSHDGSVLASDHIVVTNYERLHYFDYQQFSGVVCDESSILKNFDGKRKAEITEFMRRIPHRLLCTATAAPNDFDELGTSSEALGYLGYQDMISRFFTQQTSKDHLGWGRTKYRLRGHAVTPFWQWVCSWSRPIRKPSDYGFDDDGFILPELVVSQTVVDASRPRDGMLFVLPAETMQDQREERRMTIRERCQRVAALVSHGDYSVSWCHLNAEGDMLEKLIDGAIQVSGSDSDDAKEEKLIAFSTGQAKKLVTKARIAGFGLNWQHCAHMTAFPSHSWEQYYQSTRRLLRFGQLRPVAVDVVTTKGEQSVLQNLLRKQEQADAMFDRLIEQTQQALHIEADTSFTQEVEVAPWL